MSQFSSACAAGNELTVIIDACVAQLGAVADQGLGFVYVNDPLADRIGEIVGILRQKTGIAQWFGTVGIGVCGTGIEHFEQPAISVLTCAMADDSLRAIPSLGTTESIEGSIDDGFFAALAVVHADPRNGAVVDVIAQLSQRCGAFLVGGLTAAQSSFQQISAGAVCEGGVSGVCLGGRLNVSVGLTQGCSPIGSVHAVTAGRQNIIAGLDGQPAFAVLCEDVGVADNVDPRPWLANVHAAVTVPGSDTGDYLVRNLVGLDPEQGLVAIAEEVDVGDHIVFVRRDAASAEKDLKRMLGDLKARMAGPPKAGLYFSCVARGPNLFDAEALEMTAIRDAFGDIPMAGFFGNGEISNDRLYAYTGVLTLFH